MIAPGVSIADKSTRGRYQIPAPSIPDGEGGYREQWIDLEPKAFVHIAPASPRALERLAAGTTFATATHVVTAPYRADVPQRARFVADNGQTLRILGVQDNHGRKAELLMFCTEVL